METSISTLYSGTFVDTFGLLVCPRSKTHQKISLRRVGEVRQHLGVYLNSVPTGIAGDHNARHKAHLCRN